MATTSVTRQIHEFDYPALVAALDADRVRRGWTWTVLAEAMSEQSAVLNARPGDHCLCPGALVRQTVRTEASCQYALVLLRWLGRAPEEFLAVPRPGAPLPVGGPDRRLRFDLPALYAEVESVRVGGGLGRAEVAAEIGCSPGRLAHLRTARSADMGLVMRVLQWVDRPAAGFVVATDD